MRPRFRGIRLLLVLAAEMAGCAQAAEWGGSIGLSSDYMVRGISRTNDGAALQGDVHYGGATGFFAGVFVSNTQFDAGDRRDVEFDVYGGFAWRAGSDWSGNILASHYTYPWNPDKSGYDYDEFDISVTFQEWLSASVVYSPNAWRDAASGALIGVPNEAAELNLQRPLIGKLSGIAGIGYSHLAGPSPGGYGYWSVGAAYDLAPVSIVVSFVDTTARARSLFDNAVVRRWTGMLIWRF